MTNRTERWKSIPVAPEFEVSSRGRIRSPRGRILKTFMTGGGLNLTVKYDSYPTCIRVARAVGEAFCPDYQSDRYPAYRDKNRHNCKATNLKWVPRSAVTGDPYSKNPKS